MKVSQFRLRLVFYLTLGLAAAVFLFSFSGQTLAGSVSGWSWSSNVGWMAWSCRNAGNTGGDICASTGNFGVNIDGPSGIVSGYAWASNPGMGWISFNRSETGIPPAAPFNGAETYIAKLDTATNQLEGWGRALAGTTASGGWDGWIKFNGPTYGVVRGTGAEACELKGFAWGGTASAPAGQELNASVIGWIDVNCKQTNGETATCGFGNWMVQLADEACGNLPPAVSLGTPTQSAACTLPVTSVFSWTIDDPNDDQMNWQFQVDEDTSGIIGDGIGEADWVGSAVDRSGGPVNDNNPYVGDHMILVYETAQPDVLLFGRTYAWRVKAIDINGNDSGWVYASDSQKAQTPPSPPPSAVFQCSKDTTTWYSSCSQLPHTDVDDIVYFRNKIKAEQEVTYDNYQWDFTSDGTFDIAGPDKWGPDGVSNVYNERGTYYVNSCVTRGASTCCAVDQMSPEARTVRIQFRLPTWKEVAPQ